MTISSLVNKNQYLADGTLTTYTYAFRILDASDIRVVTTSPLTGLDTVLALGIDYTVTGVGNASGGTIVFTIAPISMYRVTLMRDTQALQPEHYVENDPFPAEAHEIALDRAATVAQTTDEEISRAVRVGYGTDANFRTLLPPITPFAAGKSLVVRKDLTGIDFGADSFIVGPSVSTDNAVPRFDGVTGKLLKDSLVLIDDTGQLSAPSITTPKLTATDTSTTVLHANTAVITDLAVTDKITAVELDASSAIIAGKLTAPEVDAVNLTVSGNFHADTYGPVETTIVNAPVANLDHITTKDVTIIPDTTPGSVIYMDASGNKYVGFRSPTAVTSSVIYDLPPVDGIPGQVLTTDGFGKLTWETGVPQQPFLGTLATLADVRFTNLRAGNLFSTPNGRVWSNPSPGTFMNFQPPSPYISYTNASETRAANINMNRNQIKGASLKQKLENTQSLIASSTTAIDVSQGMTVTLNQSMDTVLQFANPSSSGQQYSFVLIRVKDASNSSRAVTWPSNVKWSNGTAPTLTQSASATDVFLFRTIDGNSWFGYAISLGADFITAPQPKPFTGTLASLSDVTFANENAGQMFATSDGTTYTNSSNYEPYSTNISEVNIAESRSANINMGRSKLKGASFINKKQDAQTLSATASTILDVLVADSFTLNQSLDTTLVFNSPASSSHYSFTLIRVKDNTATARAITWPSSVKWSNASAPTLTQTASSKDAFIFRTIDAGNSWLGYSVSSAIA